MVLIFIGIHLFVMDGMTFLTTLRH